MSSSTYSLKKKVCVTVFLDELFEEVLEDDRRELRQVSDTAEPEVKSAEKPYSEPSRIDLSSDEKVNASSNADSEQLHVQLRPRKHRRESKFSKNHCDSFENELARYDYSSCDKRKNECIEHVESTASESDFVLDEFLNIDKWKVENKSSSSELSELELKGSSFLSVNPILSSAIFLHPKEEKVSKEKSALSFCNKSTQFDGIDLDSKKIEGRVDYYHYVEKQEREAENDVFTWKETQKEIRLILAKSRHQEKETCEGDYLRHYDLRSIIEDCVKTKENTPSKSTFANFKEVFSNQSIDFNESDLFDSYTRVFPHNKRRNGTQAPEVKKIWARTKKNSWYDGFESDLSEADYTPNTAELGLYSFQKDVLSSCNLSLKCNKKSQEENTYSGAVQSFDNFGSTSRGSSFENIKSRSSQKTDFLCKTVIDLARETVLGARLITEQEKLEDTKNEGGFPLKLSKSLLALEGRNKNFAEGDTFEESLNQDSKFILDMKAKEKLFVCNEILKHVTEPKVIHNEIIVNLAEIELDPQENAKKETEIVVLSPHQSLSVSAEVAEVFFRQNDFENVEKSVTDFESEMDFAESENFFDNEDFLGDGLVSSFSRAPQNDVCVVEFEDKLSRSKILRRMKTVKILGDSSISDMKNISTEVILICENVSNNEICLEAWQKSTSTLKSFTEMRQCYLKDSKDSAMYLVEIPLQFIRAKRKTVEGDQFFKYSRSN